MLQILYNYLKGGVFATAMRIIGAGALLQVCGSAYRIQNRVQVERLVDAIGGIPEKMNAIRGDQTTNLPLSEVNTFTRYVCRVEQNE
jgi:hypothetical protein